MRFLLQRDQKAHIVDGHFSATCAILFLDVRYYIIKISLRVPVSRIFRDIIAQQVTKSRKRLQPHDDIYGQTKIVIPPPYRAASVFTSPIVRAAGS